MASQRNINKEAEKKYRAKLNLIRSGSIVNFSETKQEKEARIEHLKKDWKAMVEYYFPHYATSECADFHIQFAKMAAKDSTFKGFAEWGRGLAKSVWVDIIIPLKLIGYPNAFLDRDQRDKSIPLHSFDWRHINLIVLPLL